MYDVVTFGETMLRLNPPKELRIEQTTSFDSHVAGSESNTAVGLARLGASVNWFSRLPNTQLGKLIANRIREQGVDISDIIWADDERLGLYFLEKSSAPRPTQVIYDRSNSAMSNIQASDLPSKLFQEGQAKCLHISGITLALSNSAAETVIAAMKMAKEAGWRISFDVNYRSKLWSANDARSGCDLCMQEADIIFTPLRDAQLLFDYAEDMSTRDVLADLHGFFPHAVIVMSHGEQGSLCCSPDGSIIMQDAFAVDGTSRIGAGDSFSAGFLYSYLCQSKNLEQALKWGNAVAALKFTIAGDMPLVDKSHVEALIEHKTSKKLIR